MNEITLDGGTFRRIQHNGRTYWESVHPLPGVVMWFDNTDETTRPYRTLACALDRIAEMEADDAVKSESFRTMWDHSRAVDEKLAAVNAMVQKALDDPAFGRAGSLIYAIEIHRILHPKDGA